MNTVILGAGLAGLSAAYHLGGRCRVFEKEAEAGGFCRSDTVGGYRFDYSGHLLHFRSSYCKSLVHSLVGDELRLHGRRSAVRMRGRDVPFPLQANLSALPEGLARGCLESFRARQPRPGGTGGWQSYSDWAACTFGRVMAEEFFLPYGRKFWRSPLEQMDSGWAGRFTPVPSPGDVERGARGEAVPGMGYNAEFAYPCRGGIGSLVQALCCGMDGLHLGRACVGVSPGRREITLAGGATVGYGELVSTLPLPALIRLMGREAPAAVAGAAAGLKATCIYNVNLGVNRPGVLPWHWMYFPEDDFVFYRVGSYSSFFPGAGPPGTSALYAEVSLDANRPEDEASVTRQVVAGLVRAGVLGGSEDVDVVHVQKMSPAYVICDCERDARLADISGFLESCGVLSIGRYGRWSYMTMEEAILDGRDAARRILAADRDLPIRVAGAAACEGC